MKGVEDEVIYKQITKTGCQRDGYGNEGGSKRWDYLKIM